MTKFNYANKAMGAEQGITNILQLSGKYLFKRNYPNTSGKKATDNAGQKSNEKPNLLAIKRNFRSLSNDYLKCNLYIKIAVCEGE